MIRWLPRWTAPAAVAAAYLAVSLPYLDTSPPVGEDEPWLAAGAYKLATQGVYGSDLFTGYYGSEHRLYGVPLYPLLLAAMFRLAGVGVFQMRLVPVLCGLLVLLLAYAVGRQLGGFRLGLLAMILLLGMRLAAGWSGTGIPLLDTARTGRQDIVVPVLGLAALWLFLRAEALAGARPATGRAARLRAAAGPAEPATRWYLLCGIAIGLATLAHLYGGFWAPALLLVMWLRCGRSLFQERAPVLLLSGIAVVWLPWALYIAAGWEDFLGQQRLVAERFALFDPRFYLDNLLAEAYRYRQLAPLDLSGRWYLGQFGTWVAVAGLPVALLSMLRRGKRNRHDRAFAVAVILLAQGAMFALLLKQKMFNYLIALWPLAVLALAWLGLEFWRRHRSAAIQGALAALLAVILIEGSARITHHWSVAVRMTPYPEFTARIATYIPPGSRVLGFQHYWLGLRQYPYRTWMLPLMLSSPRFHHAPLPFEEALAQIDPEIILIDRHMGGYLEQIADPRHPDHSLHVALSRFMVRRNARLAGVVEDTTYGTMRIYHLGHARGGSQAGGESAGEGSLNPHHQTRAHLPMTRSAPPEPIGLIAR